LGTTSPKYNFGESVLRRTTQGTWAAQDDPDLAAIIDAWDRLPEALRTGIVAMTMVTSVER